MSTTVLISDLHLSEQTFVLTRLFTRLLTYWQGRIDALYILGDFFDAWVGDDDDSEFAISIQSTLKQFAQSTPIYFQHGNRDFLVGQKFADSCQLTLLPESYYVQLYDHNYLLTHGDILCTDDVAYQQFRQQSRNPLWQQAILQKSLPERRLLVQSIRQMSEQRKAIEGQSEISDATEQGIQQLMQSVSEQSIPTLIHGHTHRPAIHQHQFQNQNFQRYVLSDWHDNRGGCLYITPKGVETRYFDDVHFIEQCALEA